MKILHVTRYGSVKGGAETYVRALCDGLRARGHHTALAYALDPDPTRPEVAEGYEVPELAEPGPGGNRDQRGFRLAQVIKAYAPDVIHCHVTDPPFAATLCNALAPTLLAAHDHRLDSPAGTKYWAAFGKPCTIRPGIWCLGYNVVARCGSLRANATLRPYRAWRQARDGAALLGMPVQVFSEHMRGELERAHIAPDRVRVIPYPAPPLVEASRPAEPDPRPVVLASGRLNKEKGFHLLIDAMARVKVRTHLVLAGEGHARASLERRARTATGGHRITFTGWLAPTELAGWLERAAVVAIPSAWPEPFGIAGLEAMARGKPVVAFDSGGMREWLDDGETGVLAPQGDVFAFAAALTRLLEDEGERGRMGEAGRARIASAFSLEAHLDRLEPVYEEVRRSHRV